jgi:hypothetical protein
VLCKQCNHIRRRSLPTVVEEGSICHRTPRNALLGWHAVHFFNRNCTRDQVLGSGTGIPKDTVGWRGVLHSPNSERKKNKKRKKREIGIKHTVIHAFETTWRNSFALHDKHDDIDFLSIAGHGCLHTLNICLHTLPTITLENLSIYDHSMALSPES